MLQYSFSVSNLIPNLKTLYCSLLCSQLYYIVYSPPRYPTLLYSTLLYAILCYTMLLYAILCYTTLLYATLIITMFIYYEGWLSLEFYYAVCRCVSKIFALVFWCYVLYLTCSQWCSPKRQCCFVVSVFDYSFRIMFVSFHMVLCVAYV